MKIFSLFFFLLLSITATETFAVDFTVNQAGDAGDLTCDATCTLRDAVDDANAAATNDTISFAAGLTTITLTNEIVINNAGTLTITGTGANVLTIDGGAGTNRIFYINQAKVTVSGAILTGGNGMGAYYSDEGGAIFADNALLILDSVHITGNRVNSMNGGGGVLFKSGTHRINNSTFSGNIAPNCAGFSNSGTLTVTNIDHLRQYVLKWR